jgi:hypothetical protein
MQLEAVALTNNATFEIDGIITQSTHGTITEILQPGRFISVNIGGEEVLVHLTLNTVLTKKEVTVLEDGSMHELNRALPNDELEKLTIGQSVSLMYERAGVEGIAHEISL